MTFFVMLACHISTIALSVGIQYSMHDVICSVNYSGNVRHLDRSSGTLCTVGGGGCGRCIAWQRFVGGTTVTTDEAKSSVKT